MAEYDFVVNLKEGDIISIAYGCWGVVKSVEPCGDKIFVTVTLCSKDVEVIYDLDEIVPVRR